MELQSDGHLQTYSATYKIAGTQVLSFYSKSIQDLLKLLLPAERQIFDTNVFIFTDAKNWLNFFFI